ncbi:MAG: hypothetical protein AAFU74_12375 [Bacteroidota bacterium]
MNESNTSQQVRETISTSDQLVNARKEALETQKKKPDAGFEWLTEHSRNFLNSGYLTEGITGDAKE